VVTRAELSSAPAQGGGYLAGIRKSPEGLFRKYQLTVDRDLEHAARALDE